MPFFKKTVWILFLHHAVGGLNSGQSDKILFDTGFRPQMDGVVVDNSRGHRCSLVGSCNGISTVNKHSI